MTYTNAEHRRGLNRLWADIDRKTFDDIDAAALARLTPDDLLRIAARQRREQESHEAPCGRCRYCAATLTERPRSIEWETCHGAQAGTVYPAALGCEECGRAG